MASAWEVVAAWLLSRIQLLHALLRDSVVT
jgi:hypothetical protein